MSTLYQVTFTTTDGRELLVGYTARRSRVGLINCALGIAPEAWRAVGMTEETAERRPANDRRLSIEYEGAGVLRFSGVTWNDVAGGMATEPARVGLGMGEVAGRLAR